MFGFFLCEGPVRNFSEAKTNDAELFGKLHREMIKRGVYLAPSPFEPRSFVSDLTCWSKPATRISKNSSRFELKNARNFIRSSRG